ncbi:hypothetical protein AA21291_0812 [Swaminathania salitolerans LMG 21291]|uniref:Uncharacterized protein n=1 Tax=Swaminathania salitolerans TaxID=182838 RepID=A0A511BQX2_9PROT|nr:hypothetical protein AA21291_0812 [Swaminathania salitolerans LMG 21291]GEL02472.1 hypothetical protein SSA02_16350 [Swaminathania salitolerans]
MTIRTPVLPAFSLLPLSRPSRAGTAPALPVIVEGETDADAVEAFDAAHAGVASPGA